MTGKGAKGDKKKNNADGRACNNCSAPEGSPSASKLSAYARCGLVVYCSKECQRDHWKANHKQYCVAKVDGIRRVQNASETLEGTDDSCVADKGEICAICQDPLANESSLTLSCTHTFHGNCIAQLRKLSIKQICPVCRTPLPPGPEKVFEAAIRLYMVVDRLVERGHASWSTLPRSAQQDLDSVIIGLQTAADQGYFEAQYNLGVMFREGRGVPQSDVEAVRWYRKAADQGHPYAQHNLAVSYNDGDGVAQSYVEAVRWYRKAADQGHVHAQFNMGVMFRDGSGVAQSDTEAVRWHRRAADQDHAGAQYSLGTFFEEGHGVARSDTEAARWYRKAADQGHVHAQLRLGLMFKNGSGVAQSDVEAVRWFRKAADQSYADAQYVLGLMFRIGCGVNQSDTEAARWFKKAADQGHAEAKRRL